MFMILEIADFIGKRQINHVVAFSLATVF